ncbi:MAG: arylsulfatase, partial [Novosphingobium sp.]
MTMKRFTLAVAALLSGTSAMAQTDRSVLPVPAPAFDGQIAENVLDSKPGSARPVQAPQGAPNVLVMMSDDVGFAMSSAFGGPVPTPNYDRLAAQGQRYNRFHTTGICSPSRAALLTGRNHHNAGVGFLSDLGSNFPGYGGQILPETATIARVLTLNGYSTAMFGKHHNTPSNERSEAGPFNNWPTGLGFEYFLGFPHGDTDQYSPILYRGTGRIPQDSQAGDLLDKRLADDMIRWVHNQKAAAPDKPFFIYFAPGSTHAPHQAPKEYIERFKGQFDQGWDRLREETLRRQIAAGIVPKGTRLTPRPEGIPAWTSLTPGQKAFASRSMEVAAAQLAYQDEQMGRVIEELKRMGQFDNTLIMLVHGDNGASGEAGPKGTINELRGMAVHDERQAWLEANIDQLGGEMTYGNYPVGWAWAMNAPLRWVKQFGSMLGGVRNGMIMSWGNRAAHPGSVCAQFSHLIDVVPTVLDAAKLPAPDRVNGVAQKPIDG